MVKNVNSRTRLLCIVEILTMYSDEMNIISAEEICEKLGEYGYEASKRSVLSDIRIINTTSVKIISVSSPKKGFYLAKSSFPSASRMIIDAVFSSDLFTADEIEYIKSYLKESICVPSLKLVLATTKNFSSPAFKKGVQAELLYGIRVAVKNRKKLDLTVSRIVPGNYFSPSKKLEKITVNPLYIAAANRMLFLIFIRDEKSLHAECINIFRINSAIMKDEPAFIPQKIPTEITNYFDGRTVDYCNCEARWIILEFHESDTEFVESHFRESVQYRKSEKAGFCTAKIFTVISDELIGWLFLNSDKVTVLAPDSLYELLKNKAKNIL